MYLERLLQINSAAIAAIATLLLGMGERSSVLPLGMLVAAFSSVWVTDVARWIRLNRRVSNVAAAIAVLLAVWDLVEMRSSSQIFAIANLLIYLQLILLFQEKELRTYWQLIALSLLEVVIAAAFNQGAMFGVLLVGYLIAGLSAMVLLFLYGERLRYHRAEASPPQEADRTRRWPLAGQTPRFAGAAMGLSARVVVSRELWAWIGRIAVGTLVIALVFFFATPRLGHTAWQGPGGAVQRTIGFSDKVKLGELGRAIENPQEVLRVHFVDPTTRQPHQVHGELYLRGALLTDYTRGQWASYEHPGGERYRPIKRDSRLPGEELVRQVVTIEPLDHQELFCVWPFRGTTGEPDPRLLFDVRRQRLLRTEEYAAKQVTYELDTPAVAGGRQTVLTPNDGRFRQQSLLAMPPAETLPGLVATAQQWLQETSLAPDDRLQRATHLERKFSTSDQFAYSLQGQARDRTLDPIEDFVTKHRRGHCEYFATALVLMLRSQGIPSRFVVGFKTDEWNDLGGFFQVRQLHAHTWVEVYLEPRHLPAELIHGERHWDWSDGAWLRLDPTPAERDEQIASGSPLVRKMDRYLSWIEHLWDTYVVSMDSPRQREAIYQPLIDAVERTARRLSDPAWWRGVLVGLGRWLWAAIVRLGSFWGLVTIAAVTTGVLLVARFCFGIAPRRLFSRLTAQSTRAKQSERSRIEFYRRLETILARHGLTRAPHQTPREFAHAAGIILAQTPGHGELGALPSQIAEAFYRVRFGGIALDATQSETIETALGRLDEIGDAVTSVSQK